MKENIPSLYPQEYDLKNCDKEPIRIIRRLQSYASLLVLDLQLSKWHFATEDLVTVLEDKSIHEVLCDDKVQNLRALKQDNPLRLDTVLGSRVVTKYVIDGLVYIEFEDTEPEIILMDEYQNSIIRVTDSKDFSDLLDTVIDEVRMLTGYDHIMIYKFDEEYHGEVIKETRTYQRPKFLGIKFPSTDIPEQARALYFKETIRTIANVKSPQVPIYKNPESHLNDALSLVHIHSRGVSPIHLEYLTNIRVEASFSVAITKDDKLWGLIACHNTRPQVINHRTRKWLKFLSKLISTNISKIFVDDYIQHNLKKQLNKNEILASIADTNDLVKSLKGKAVEMMDLVNAEGMIVKSGEEVDITNNIRSIINSENLFNWLQKQKPFDVIHTYKSIDLLPEDIYNSSIAGLLIIQLSYSSQDYIIFTRPEISKEVTWAGNPNEAKHFSEEKGRLTPRKSFENWSGIIENTSNTWSSDELEVAEKIKDEIREYLYKKYNELLLLNKELKEAYDNMESFSYIVSHDLKAPLRSIDGFVKILAEDYAKQLDDYGLELIDMIVANINRMNEFIKDILNYSKFNSNKLRITKLELIPIIREIWLSINDKPKKSKLDLPNQSLEVYGDSRLIHQVFQNLLTNSLKYVGKEDTPEIKVSFEQKEKFVKITLQDNGIGIPKGKEKEIFDIFRRMVSDDDYEGSGVGLAIVKKVIDRHGGEIAVDTNYTNGAKFDFTLPSNEDFINFINKRVNK